MIGRQRSRLGKLGFVVCLVSGAFAQPEIVHPCSAESLIVKWVEPIYPISARSKGIRGTVLLDVVIGKDGHVVRAETVSGIPVLADAARQAIMQWVYKPSTLNGEAVDVAIKVKVTFPRPKPIKTPSSIRCG